MIFLDEREGLRSNLAVPVQKEGLYNEYLY
jgi:hypothetical protein